MATHCDSDQSLKLSATACSDQSVVRSPRHPSIETRVCLVDTAGQNEALIQALKKITGMEVLVVKLLNKGAGNKTKYLHSFTNMSIDVPFLTSCDGSEYANCDDPHYETVFVLEEFDGDIFNRLKNSDNRVLGSPVVMHVASTNEPLPYTYRPQYCSCMQGLILCFTNFKTKEHLTQLVTLCHYMGACIRKDMSAKVDFLITNVLHGPKYRTAVSLGIPVVKEDWVHMCWEARKRCGFHATDDEFVLPCKSKPFEGCILSFLGFSEKEGMHMQEQAIQQGAKVAEAGDGSCTHLVVEEDNVKTLPFHPHERLFVVIQEWFWGSIQIEARAAESMYFFEVAEQRPMMTRSSTTSSLLGTPQKWRDSNAQPAVMRSSTSKYSFCRKRSRLREETLAKLSQDSDRDTTKQPPTKRPSTDTSTCINESLLDISNNTTIVRSPRGSDLFKDSQNGKKAISARYQVAMEFLQTETNYVGILNTILMVFKQPLEDPKQAGGSLLPSENIKAIFGSLPEIQSVHTRMAADLTKVMCNWVDESCIGCIVNKYAAEFVRCYPPFVNFFEMAKETITSCEASLPRFHAFLKINQAKKECGRQTLAELLINPVQRLPRIILLLQDIKKHTARENENHPDVAGIQAALDAVKEVMTHINEDKRKTESQKQIFDIVYEVDGCPPTIVSSHRQFITRAELISVDDNLSSKGDHICLFLFSDCVELAKRKRGAKSHSFKSPNVHARGAGAGAVRCLKHIKLISLSHIKKVVNVKNSEDCQSAFSLFCRTPTDTQDWLYTFKMLSCTSDCGQNDSKNHDQQSNATLTHDDGKARLLQLLSRYRANTVCKASDDNFVHTLASRELDISTSDVGSTIGRAVRAAKKSHKKLTRVFSFSRTPRHAVQRAVSSMMSPASKAALPPSERITPGLGTTPSRAAQASRLYGSQMSVNSYDMEEQDCGASSSGLTPSMSISNICTPQRDRRGNRLSSSASLKVDGENMYDSSRRGIAPSVSMMSLKVPSSRPVTRALTEVKNDVFQVPTPPVRRKRTGAAKTMKAATVALGRVGSFRRKNKAESWL